MIPETQRYIKASYPRSCKDTLIEYVNRFSYKTMERLDEEVILALASDGVENDKLIEYIERLAGRSLSDLDFDIILKLARAIAKGEKETNHVSG